jgi:hypothetical protein
LREIFMPKGYYDHRLLQPELLGLITANSVALDGIAY